MFDFKVFFFFDKVSAQGYAIHFKRRKLIFVNFKDFNPEEFVCVIRFAEFKKKLGTSHVPASLIVRAIEKFDFKRSHLERP